MNVEVAVATDITDKVDAVKIAEAAEFYARILMSERQFAGIDIEIIIENDADVAGSVTWEDTNDRPKMFTIELALNSDEDIFRNLAHEMVHVKQYRTGELKELIRAKKIKFNGKEYSDEYYTDADLYYDAPWEIEAYGREIGLYRKWLIKEGK